MKYIKKTDEKIHELWFCCLVDSEDGDCGTGSFDLAEAVDMCKNSHFTLIGVIDSDASEGTIIEALEDLNASDYFDLTTEQIHNEQSWIAEKYHFIEVVA